MVGIKICIKKIIKNIINKYLYTKIQNGNKYEKFLIFFFFLKFLILDK